MATFLSNDYFLAASNVNPTINWSLGRTEARLPRRAERAYVRSLRPILFVMPGYVLLIGALCISSIRVTISAGTAPLWLTA